MATEQELEKLFPHFVGMSEDEIAEYQRTLRDETIPQDLVELTDTHQRYLADPAGNAELVDEIRSRKGDIDHKKLLVEAADLYFSRVSLGAPAAAAPPTPTTTPGPKQVYVPGVTQVNPTVPTPDPQVTQPTPDPAQPAQQRDKLPLLATIGLLVTFPASIAALAHPKVRSAVKGRLSEMMAPHQGGGQDSDVQHQGRVREFLSTTKGKIIVAGGALALIAGGVFLNDRRTPDTSLAQDQDLCSLVNNTGEQLAEESLIQSGGNVIQARVAASDVINVLGDGCTQDLVAETQQAATRYLDEFGTPSTTPETTVLGSDGSSAGQTTTTVSSAPADLTISCVDLDGDGQSEISFDGQVVDPTIDIPFSLSPGSACNVPPGATKRVAAQDKVIEVLGREL